jgi:SRSO17 transposase
MSAYLNEWADCFVTNSKDGAALATRYVGGLLSQTKRKNMERIDERLAPKDDLWVDSYQATQQFISDSPWDEAKVYVRIAQRSNEILASQGDTTLLIDESSFAKKGTSSVGVSRQWNGRLGKEDNCQTGVFSALCHGQRVCITGARLFLPDEWINNPERCEASGVPEEIIKRGKHTKIDLAQELIEEAIANGLKFSCVAMDAFYGRDATLRRRMEELNLIYCVDLPANTYVFEQRPAGATRPARITQHAIRVDALAEKMRADKDLPVEEIKLRNGDNGPVEAMVRARRVWEWNAGASEPTELWLILRDMPDGSVKISLCNALRTTRLAQLSRWQASRFWVERCFQDAKSHCGMSGYQSRGWLAWHHHMALVAVAVLFGTIERVSGELCPDELTMADIEELMEWALVARPSEADLLDRIQKRHRKRRLSANAKLTAAEQAKALRRKH